jgi:hypothetical protein
METENNWMQGELEDIKADAPDVEKKPALKLEENQTVEIVVDFSKPFDKWTNPDDKSVKAIIPVTVDGSEFVWWLNTKNPVYSDILAKGVAGESTIKVHQSGTQKNTRYTLK